VPYTLGQQLQCHRGWRPEILEWGLRELLAETSGEFQDENAIMQLLTSQPTPEQVLAICPSPELQARVSALLAKSKEGSFHARRKAN